MSIILSQFYLAIQMWIELGCPIGHGFNPDAGLCPNLAGWLKRQDLPAGTDPWSIHRELYRQFTEAGLDSEYPFNHKDRYEYLVEADCRSIFKNPDRLAWVASCQRQVKLSQNQGENPC